MDGRTAGYLLFQPIAIAADGSAIWVISSPSSPGSGVIDGPGANNNFVMVLMTTAH